MLSSQIPPERRRETIRDLLVRPRRMFIYYVDRSQHHNEHVDRLRALAAEAGLLEEPLTKVKDRNDRPVYSVVRYVNP